MTFARPVPRTAGQADRNDGHQQRRSIGETSDFSDSALIEEEDYDDEDHEDNQNAQVRCHLPILFVIDSFPSFYSSDTLALFGRRKLYQQLASQIVGSGPLAAIMLHVLLS